MRFDLQFIKNNIPDAQIIHGVLPTDISFSIDSRSIKSGQIFVAVEGSRVNGHDFLSDALTNGAAGFIIAAHHKEKLSSLPQSKLKNTLTIIVTDPVACLITLAIAWRKQFTYPVVGITGSFGKTTTKEILKTVLETNGTSVIASEGNQNTRIGVALNIFRMRTHHQVAIFELGISKRGEMAELARILRPTTAIITAIGHAHMEGLGSLQDIAQEKRDIFKYFDESSIGIINGDQPILTNVGYAHPVIKFGSKTINQVQARKIQVTNAGIQFVLKLYRTKYTVSIAQPHEGIIFNILAATAAAYLLQVPVAKILEGIQKPINVTGRFEEKSMIEKKGKVIHDCYNANPESMKAALIAFQKIETKAQKIAVLGDMLELGVNAPFWHRQLGRFLRKVPSLRHVILVGDMVAWTKKTVPVTITVDHVRDWQEAIDKLENKLDQESMVLIKGSRGVALENIVRKYT